MVTIVEHVIDVAYVVVSFLYVAMYMMIYENPILIKIGIIEKKEFIKGVTPWDFQGPELKLGAPRRKYSLIEDPRSAKMPIVVMSGHVIDFKTGKPIAGAELNIWHPDYNGRYSLLGYDCRGIITTDQDGKYEFESTVPGCLTLNSLCFGFIPKKFDTFRRPGHYHVLIKYNGKSYCTQVYTTKMYLVEDSVRKGFNMAPLTENLITFEEHKPDSKYDKPYFTGHFDFVLP